MKTYEKIVMVWWLVFAMEFSVILGNGATRFHDRLIVLIIMAIPMVLGFYIRNSFVSLVHQSAQLLASCSDERRGYKVVLVLCLIINCFGSRALINVGIVDNFLVALGIVCAFTFVFYFGWLFYPKIVKKLMRE